MLFIIPPPLPELTLSLSDPEDFDSFSFFPSEPFRRNTSKRVGLLFGDALPKAID